MRQMRQLIIDLCNTTHPFTCPHGRPCMIAVTSDELYKLFKRTGFDLPGKNDAPYDK
jgi:DNA mismatch repair protein MutL